MKLHYLILSLPIFILSCGEPSEKTNNDTLLITDSFREDVLKLRSVGLIKNIPDNKLDSLISIYKKDSVNGLQELLVASGDLLKINVSLNGRKLEDVYQKFCDTIGARYPELKCDEVQTSILPSSSGEHDTNWVLVRLRFGTTWYERKLYYLQKWQVDDFVYRIFNRMLADSGKQVRLHFVGYNCPGCSKEVDDFMGDMDVSRYGYLLLTKTQEDSLIEMDRLRMERETEFSLFTTKEVENQLKLFESSGLVESIGVKWYSKAKTDIYQSSIYRMEDLYDFLDTLFTTVQFDTTNYYNPYQEILGNLSLISRGKFMPESISDEISSANLHKVQFTFQEDIYSFDAVQKGGIYFTGILDNVNKALEDHKTGGAFYSVGTDQQRCTLIYIEDKKLEKVKSSGFFPQLYKGASKELRDRYAMEK